MVLEKFLLKDSDNDKNNLLIAHHREQSLSNTHLAKYKLACKKVSGYGDVSVKIILWIQ